MILPLRAFPQISGRMNGSRTCGKFTRAFGAPSRRLPPGLPGGGAERHSPLAPRHCSRSASLIFTAVGSPRGRRRPRPPTRARSLGRRGLGYRIWSTATATAARRTGPASCSTSSQVDGTLTPFPPIVLYGQISGVAACPISYTRFVLGQQRWHGRGARFSSSTRATTCRKRCAERLTTCDSNRR